MRSFACLVWTPGAKRCGLLGSYRRAHSFAFLTEAVPQRDVTQPRPGPTETYGRAQAVATLTHPCGTADDSNLLLLPLDIHPICTLRATVTAASCPRRRPARPRDIAGSGRAGSIRPPSTTGEPGRGVPAPRTLPPCTRSSAADLGPALRRSSDTEGRRGVMKIAVLSVSSSPSHASTYRSP